jgi:hypothetical protein
MCFARSGSPLILAILIFPTLGGNVLIKDGKRQEEPGDSLVLMLPVLAMAALIGILALLMRSTGKW